MKKFVQSLLFCASVTLFVFSLLGCGGSDVSNLLNPATTTGIVTQTWEFITPTGDIATAKITGGAGDAESWTIDFDGTGQIKFDIKFGVQFSGKLVRLLTFRKVVPSAFTNISVIGTGDGQANGDFGTATAASGKVTLNYQSPLGATSGTANWTARRVN